MVQFPRYRFRRLCIHPRMDAIQDVRVTPFGHPRISGCLLLPVAFRSLPRPSSPDSSKASPANSYSLDHITPTSNSRSIKLGIANVRSPEQNSSDVVNLLCSLLLPNHDIPPSKILSRPRRQCRRSEAVKDLILKGPAVSTARGRRKDLCTRHQRAVCPISCNGGMGIRTPDLWLAKPSL